MMSLGFATSTTPRGGSSFSTAQSPISDVGGVGGPFDGRAVSLQASAGSAPPDSVRCSGPPVTTIGGGMVGLPSPWPYPPPPPPPHPALFAAAAAAQQTPPGLADGLSHMTGSGGGHVGLVGQGGIPVPGGASLMENWENWRQFQQAAYANNLDPHVLAFYHNAGCAVDLTSAPRRKNATRETTSMLKAWLNEHRKNPYPTKGEKIMLAIITKMTLTQVSTWFANARRRLKKENKMTWSPRNRSEEERQHGAGDDDDGPGMDQIMSDEDDLRSINVDNEEEDLDDLVVEKEEDEEDGGDDDFKDQLVKRAAVDVESKPKIWSLVDLATKSDSYTKRLVPPPPSGLNFTSSSSSTASVARLLASKQHPTVPLSVSSNGSLPPICFPPSTHHHFSLANLLPPGPPGGPPVGHMFTAAGKMFPGLSPRATTPSSSSSSAASSVSSAVSAAAAYLPNPFLYPGLAAGFNPFSVFARPPHGLIPPFDPTKDQPPKLTLETSLASVLAKEQSSGTLCSFSPVASSTSSSPSKV